MAREVAAAGAAYYTEALAHGDTYWNSWLERTEQARQDVANAVGADPNSVSFLQNASLAMNIVARAIEPGSIVLALDNEFPSCTTPFIRNSCELRFIETDASGYFDADMLKRHISAKPDVFVISSVQFATGFRVELAELGALCRTAGIMLVVDASQSVGAFPIDMERDVIDVLIFTGCKWATAGYGIAAMVTAPAWMEVEPPLVGWRSARNPYALENDRIDVRRTGIGHEMGHPTFPGIFAMGEAMRQLKKVGIAALASRINGLVQKLRDGFTERGICLRTHQDPRYGSGILLAEVGDPDELCSSLSSDGVWVSSRCGGLRVSAHGYNTDGDIEKFFAALDRVIDNSRRPMK